MRIKIGQDFISPITLDLVPGVQLPRGLFKLDIQYSSSMYTSHLSANIDSNSTIVEIGNDVYMIDVFIYRHNSFPSNPQISIRYQMRIDQLLMLNLAIKLLRAQ